MIIDYNKSPGFIKKKEGIPIEKYFITFDEYVELQSKYENSKKILHVLPIVIGAGAVLGMGITDGSLIPLVGGTLVLAPAMITTKLYNYKNEREMRSRVLNISTEKGGYRLS